jgi:hypothetical protein
MALFEEEGKPAPPPVQTVRPHIQPPKFDGITIDTSYVPASALLTWTSGSNWTINYYSQFLGRDNEPTPLALEREPAYQQYKLIRNMVLKVTTPISFVEDDVTRIMEVTGAGITYPFLVPNYGDMFVADIGDGRVGVFTVTRATRATILRDSVYNIEYKLVRELVPEISADLERKTIQTFNYSHDSLVAGCGPFVTEEEECISADLQALFREMVSRYLTDFFSFEHSTLLVPDQMKKTYDHFTTRAVLMILDSALDNRIRRIREMNISAEPVMRHPTLWDAVVRQDRSRLSGASQRAHLVTTSHFKGRMTLQALGYTGIDRVVFPIDVPTDVDSQYDKENIASQRPAGLPFREGRPRRPLGGPYVPQADRDNPWFRATPMASGIPPWQLPPDIHPVVIDDYYVLSAAFYTENEPQQSKLELLLWQLLNGESVNKEQLRGCLKHALAWDNLERYYYYPLAFVLLKHAGAR